MTSIPLSSMRTETSSTIVKKLGQVIIKCTRFAFSHRLLQQMHTCVCFTDLLLNYLSDFDKSRQGYQGILSYQYKNAATGNSGARDRSGGTVLERRKKSDREKLVCLQVSEGNHIVSSATAHSRFYLRIENKIE